MIQPYKTVGHGRVSTFSEFKMLEHGAKSCVQKMKIVVCITAQDTVSRWAMARKRLLPRSLCGDQCPSLAEEAWAESSMHLSTCGLYLHS